MKRIKKPPSVVTQGYGPIGNLGKFAHPPAKTKKVPGRSPTKLAKTTKSVKAPLVKAGSSVKRVAKEMGHVASYRRKTNG